MSTLIKLIKESDKNYTLQAKRWGPKADILREKIQELPTPFQIDPIPMYRLGSRELEITQITPAIECTVLDKLIDDLYSKFPLLKNANLDEVLRRIYLINRAGYYNFEDKKDMMRKYDTSMPRAQHPEEVTYQLPPTSPVWLIVLARLHDTVEDSHRYKELQEKFENIENMCDRDINQIDQELWKIIEDVINFVGLNEYSDVEKIKQGLYAITRKPYQTYEEYIHAFASIEDPELRLGLLLLKLNDRNTNSHISAPSREPKETVQEYLATIGAKKIKDGFKNFFLLNQCRQTEFDFGKDWASQRNFDCAYYGLAYTTARNMDEILQLLDSEEFKSLMYHGSSLDEWFRRIKQELNQYFKSGGFKNRTNAPPDKTYRTILNFDGTIDLLSEYIEEEMIRSENGQGINIFAGLNKGLPSHILRLYKYAAIEYTLACLFMSHIPFDVSGDLIIGGTTNFNFGTEDPNYKKYHIPLESES